MTDETTIGTIDIDIVRLGAQGDGVADTADGALFVPFALPGERVRVQLPKGRAGWRPEREAPPHVRLVEVLAASPDRQAPACRHFGRCGGCAAQHMNAATYGSWKREIVATAFAHRGLSPVIGDMMRVGAGARRRAALQATRRGGKITIGFHAAGSDELVDIAECPVLAPAIVAALPVLRTASGLLLEPGDDARITVTATPGGLDVTFEGDGLKPDAGVRGELGRIAVANGILRLTCGRDLIVQSAVPTVRFGEAAVGLPTGVFIQATAEVESAIGDIIAAAVGKAKRVADLFAGVGTFSFGLARRARVLAVDSDTRALQALEDAARHVQGLKPIETRVRDLLREPLSRKEMEGFDAVVFDPPRAGAKEQASMLAKSVVPVVVAVSCNPATLARDARILVDGGYRMETVTPIDQFVWSAHIEAVAVFRRGK